MIVNTTVIKLLVQEVSKASLRNPIMFLNFKAVTHFSVGNVFFFNNYEAFLIEKYVV